MTAHRPIQPCDDIAVLGGGMLGLTLALRLSEQGRQVTVVEAAEQLGGLTQFTADNGTTWDRFYHVIDGSDRALLNLLAELDLVDQVTWQTTATLLFDGHNHYPLNDAFDYLRLPTMNLLDKVRVGANIVYAGSRNSRGKLDDISAEQWLTRWSGGAAYRELWTPLLKSKLGSNYNKVSAAFIWSVIRRFYGARQGSQRTESFGFMPGGYARILARLSDRLKQHGVRFKLSTPVERIAADPNDHTIVLSSGNDQHRFRSVIATYASPVVLAACKGLSDEDKAAHAALRYQGVVCLSALLTRPLGGAYMTYITDQAAPFTTVIEMSALTGCANYNGHHLVYLPRYLPADDALLEASDDTLRDSFLNGLKKLYPDFEREQIVSTHIARARYVMTIPVLGYAKIMPLVKTSVDGLMICNSAQIIDASLSVNEAVALADRTASTIVS